MKQYHLIGISMLAVVILILASLTNVVGYQSVQSSNKQTINEAVNQRELLFQTIFDIANNKEIQRIILKSQMSREVFPASEIPSVTKNQIRQMYFIGLILSKIISKSKIQSMVQQNRLLNTFTQEELNGVIEKDVTLKTEINNLSASNCDCQDNNAFDICFIIMLIMAFFAFAPLMLLQSTIGFLLNTHVILYLFLYYTIGAPFFFILLCTYFLWNLFHCSIEPYLFTQNPVEIE